MTVAQSWRMTGKHAKAPKAYDAVGLERLAMHYVARYATSETRLRGYLLRKLTMGDEPESSALIVATIVAKMVRLGFVDDPAYAEMRAGALLRRGYGARRVAGAFRDAGIAAEVVHTAIEAVPISSSEAAERYAKRRRIGPYADAIPTRELRQRAIAKLLRAGHSYDDSLAVFNGWE